MTRPPPLPILRRQPAQSPSQVAPAPWPVVELGDDHQSSPGTAKVNQPKQIELPGGQHFTRRRVGCREARRGLVRCLCRPKALRRHAKELARNDTTTRNAMPSVRNVSCKPIVGSDFCVYEAMSQRSTAPHRCSPCRIRPRRSQRSCQFALKKTISPQLAWLPHNQRQNQRLPICQNP